MEINLPFRLKDIYKSRNLKTETNEINLGKKKSIYKNIKSIWKHKANLLNYINSPIKNKFMKKHPLSILNDYYKNKYIKSLSIDNSECNIHSKKNKKSLFEDDYYIEKLKKNKIIYSINKSNDRINKREIKNINHINNKVHLKNNKGNKNDNIIENEKIHILNLPNVKNNNIPPNSYLDENYFFINLNKCLESFVNKFNKEAVDEFIKKQKKSFHYSPINKTKKNDKNSSKEENEPYSLKKLIRIEPIRTNINGNIHEYNIYYEKNNSAKNKFNNTNSFKEECLPKKEKRVILPNLLSQENKQSNSKDNNSLFGKTFIINSNEKIINKTENNIVEFNHNKNNLKYKKNKNFTNLETISSNSNVTKSHSQFSSPDNLKEKYDKKYKVEINKNLKRFIYEIPPHNFYSKDYYYYNIYPQNCGWLIKNCFSHRIKWKECHSNNTNLFDFKWKDVVTIKDFIDFGISKKQIINHFEYHSCLSNKYKMFYCFAKFCENNEIDVFKYVPFTIGFDCLNYDELNIYQENFKKLFNNINNYIFENDSINNQLYDRRKIPYKQLFPLGDYKMGNKFYCEIPRSHFDGKNLWIVKAPNLNRGRCIKIFDNFNEILKFLSEIKKGNVSQYENIKDPGCKNEIIKEEKEENENNKFEKIDSKKENKEEKKGKEIIKTINDINKIEKGKIKEKKEKGDYQSDIIIIQKYIEKPFLYNGRKCDIRIWVLISHKMDAYMFKEGHLKASSVNYNINNNNSFIHLTNYSLQKYNKNFSKYETGNEISFNVFQKYLNTLNGKSFNFRETIIPKFKKIIELTAKSSKNYINQKNRNYCFEIFGYDFMMDDEKNVYLIEINTNPGLEISSEIIEKLVPRMIDDALRLTVDEIFETEYSKEWIDEKGNYSSKFHIDGYDDSENMWEFICNINKTTEKYICEDYYGFGYHKNYNKKKFKNRKDKS